LATCRLTSLLSGLGTPPLVVQAIARHADLDVILSIDAHTNLDAMRALVGESNVARVKGPPRVVAVVTDGPVPLFGTLTAMAPHPLPEVFSDV
jgi:hypothetical protein